MYAIELLRMIDKFSEKIPNLRLDETIFFIQTYGENGKYLTDIEVSLSYIKLKFESNYSGYYKNTNIFDLKYHYLNKNRSKKILFEVNNEKIEEITYLLKSNLSLCFHHGYTMKQINVYFNKDLYTYVYREEIKNASNRIT